MKKDAPWKGQKPEGMPKWVWAVIVAGCAAGSAWGIDPELITSAFNLVIGFTQ